MIGPVRAWMTVAALAAVLLLMGATSAWAAFVKEGGSYTVGNDPLSLYAGDLNDDGRPDVTTMNGSSSDLSVFLRQAGGGFAQESGSPIAVGASPSDVAIGDYTGDGLADLAVSSFSALAGGVQVLRRLAGGGFAVEGTTLAGTSMHAVAAGNFNADARLDLVATQASGQAVLLTRNAANNGFDIQSPTFTTGTNPIAIVPGDFNGDGLADVAIANRGTDNVTILRRVPGGTFTPEAAVAVGDQPVGIAAADFDGNGRADLAVSNYVSGTVSVLLRRPANDGFTAQPAIRVSNSPAGIAAADFDRDGRPDIALASNTGAIDVLLRTAAGGFTRDPSIALAGAVNDVVAADFNADTRPDLAASSYFSDATPDTFSVFVNPAPAPPQEPPLPPPVAGKSVNVEPVSGTVKIKRPGRKRFVTLTDAAQIPVGSTIDTRRGRIAITAAQGKGKTATMDFYQGLFKLGQAKRSKLTTLTLTERLSCPKAGKANAAAKKKKKRRLWGNGKGRFRTKGKHSAATVVGTKYLVQDRCSTTLTRVVRGRVKVRDFAKRKTVTVRAGKRYTARAKRN
jgi:VCBS repeat protein